MPASPTPMQPQELRLSDLLGCSLTSLARPLDLNVVTSLHPSNRKQLGCWNNAQLTTPFSLCATMSAPSALAAES